MASALQLLATGLTDPIRGLSEFNKKMGAIWEIFDLLGVQINMSGGFEVTETVVTGKSAGVGKLPEEDQEKSFPSRKEKMKKNPLRVEDEFWDGESLPKSRVSECEAENFQVKESEDCSLADEFCSNNGVFGDFENNNEAGDEAGDQSPRASRPGSTVLLQNCCRVEAASERNEEENVEGIVTTVTCQEAEDLKESPSNNQAKKNCKTNEGVSASDNDGVCATKGSLSATKKCASGAKRKKTSPLSDEELKRPFLCTYCAKRFSLKRSMTRHVDNIHLKSKPVKLEMKGEKVECVCQHCGKVISCQRNLSKHIRIMHPPNGVPRKQSSSHTERMCQHCGKVFNCQSNLSKHTKNMHPPNGVPCKHVGCSEVFVGKLEATQHYKDVHTSVEDKVDRLEQSRALSSDLKTDDDSLTPCKQCGKRFKQQSSLNDHMKKCKARSSSAQINDFSSEGETLEVSSSGLVDGNPDHSQEWCGVKEDNEVRTEESLDGYEQLDDDPGSEIVEFFEAEVQEENGSPASAAQGEDDVSQERTCPFCAKVVQAPQFEKHVRKHQPITRALN